MRRYISQNCLRGKHILHNKTENEQERYHDNKCLWTKQNKEYKQGRTQT